jgi:hypothetical protein
MSSGPDVTKEDPGVQSSTQTFWQKIEGAVAEFVAGTTVKLEEDTKGLDISFSAKNEFGTSYNFTVNGKISLTGKPQ